MSTKKASDLVPGDYVAVLDDTVISKYLSIDDDKVLLVWATARPYEVSKDRLYHGVGNIYD